MKRFFYLFLFAVIAVTVLPQCGRVAQEKKAKYVFYFIGDGMGVNQVNGTEMYLAQKKGVIGIESDRKSVV